MSALRQSLIIKILIWVPVILMAGTIFGFSKQNGEESSGISGKVASVIIDAAHDLGIVEVDDDNRAKLIDQLQTPIRKCAHMTEYAILAILIFTALNVDGLFTGYCWGTAWLFATIFAISDEIHQLFVPGRSGKVTDVLIDSIGCIVGLIILSLVRRLNKIKDGK